MHDGRITGNPDLPGTGVVQVGIRAALGLKAPETPSPWNLFMNIPVAPDGSIRFLPPVSRPGSGITLRAEMDLVLVFSACPQDMIPINGADCVPREAHFEVG